jgi:membrane dipeptidase
MIRLAWTIVILCLPALGLAAGADYEARVQRVLKQTPLIDGHNDLPWEIRERFHSQLASVDLKSDTSKLTPPPDSAPLMTDIGRSAWKWCTR